MARGRQVKSKQALQADPIYNSKLLTKMINRVMEGGRKTRARKIVYGALENLDSDNKKAVKKFEQAVKNVIPTVEVRSRRVGGATYQVPVPVKDERGETLALRWIVSAAKSKKGSPMVERLSKELQDALQNTGEAVKKKETTYKMAEANRAFAHFSW